MEDEGSRSPVYALLTNSFGFDDDLIDKDYVPVQDSADSDSSESESFQDFIPVGILQKDTKAVLESHTDPPTTQDGTSNCTITLTTDGEFSGCSLTQKKREVKKHFCVFCGKPQAKLKRHLLAAHKGEKDMVPLLNASILTEKDMFAKLRNAGDHVHNVKALKDGSGTVVVKRRKQKQTDVSKFVPCPNCVGWFSKKDLFRHKCVNKSQHFPHRQMVKQGKLLLPQDTNNDTFNEIMASLRSDPVSIIVKTDEVIKLLGLRETNKNGFDKDRHGFIRNKLRELARLLMELRNRPNCESLGLADFIRPDRFKDVVDAVRKVASYTTETCQYGTPSLALKLGHSLVRCCFLLKAKAIETGDTVLKERTEGYHQLHTIMWEQEVTSNAARNLHEQKKNTTKTIPLTEDVSKLSKYLSDETEKMLKEMSSPESITKYAWERLSVVTLVRIILFNRRRQGEASKMKLIDFTQGLDSDKHNEDVLKELNPFEKELCKVLSRIEITGKRGRIVPVILTNSMKDALQFIVTHRETIGVSITNPFVFARANNGSLGHIRGCDCIRNVVEEVDLRYPRKITSTGLRKHIATMSQLINLQDNELDVVAQYLGHDIRTHREHYRLPTSTVQVAKVAKLLLAMESGKKTHSELLPDDTIETEEEDAAEDEEKEDDDILSQPTLEGEECEDGALITSVSAHKTRDSAKRDMSKRRVWSLEEKEACRRCFVKSFSVACLPGKKEILEIQEKEPILQDRTWVQIKNFVRNMIKKKSLK